MEPEGHRAAPGMPPDLPMQWLLACFVLDKAERTGVDHL